MSELSNRESFNQNNPNQNGSPRYKNNILNYYFNSKNMNSEDIPDDINSLESSQNNNSENLRSLSKNENLNFNYSLRNNEIFYTPNRTFVEELEYDNVLNPYVNNNNTIPKSNIRLQTGESFTSLPSRVPSRRSLLINQPTQSRMNSNLFIDYNVRNNLFTNQSIEPFSSIFERPSNGISNLKQFDSQYIFHFI